MELFLDIKKFQRRFTKAHEVPRTDDPFFSLPESVDRKEFSRFYRVMAAENMEELNDISLDELVSMWGESYKFSEYFEGGQDLGTAAAKFLENETEPVIKRRRIL